MNTILVVWVLSSLGTVATATPGFTVDGCNAARAVLIAKGAPYVTPANVVCVPNH